MKMKLTEFETQHYRGSGEIVLNDLGPFTVLVGRNNSGKSNILRQVYSFLHFLSEGVVTAEGSHLTPGDLPQGIDNHITRGAFCLYPAPSQAFLDLLPSGLDIATSLPPGGTVTLEIEVATTLTPAPLTYVKSITVRRHDLSLSTCVFSISDSAVHTIRQTYARQQFRRSHIQQLDHVKRWLSRRTGSVGLLLKQLRELSPGSKLPDSLAVFGSIDQVVADLVIRAANAATGEADLASTLDAEVSVAKRQVARPLTASDGYLYEGVGDTPLQALPGYLEALIGLFASHTVRLLPERRSQIGEDEAKELLRNKTRKGGAKFIEKLQADVRKFAGVAIDAFVDDDDFGSSIEVDEFPPENNGAGIREMLSIFFDIDRKKPSFLLIEEPEIHLHPALQLNLLEFLRSRAPTCQTFVTTHSTSFIDSSQHRKLYLVTRSEQRTTAKEVRRNDDENEVLRELGLTLSSVFMFDRLVLVEGQSDIDILKSWASTIGVDLAAANVGFLPMKGVKNMRAFASSATLETLSRGRIRIGIVMDRDELTEAEIENLMSRMRPVAQLRVLDRREIENYMFDAPAILQLGLEKSAGSQRVPIVPVDTPRIRDAIELAVKSLFRDTVARVAMARLFKMTYPNREEVLAGVDNNDVAVLIREQLKRLATSTAEMDGNVDRVVDEVEEKIHEVWPAKKHVIVAGDQVLDIVLREVFGVRFNKSRDAERLASYMSADSIDPEIGALLQWIATF